MLAPIVHLFSCRYPKLKTNQTLENIKETIELNTKKNCLDTLKDIKDMVQNRQDAIEYFDEESTTKSKDPPNDPQQPVNPEGQEQVLLPIPSIQEPPRSGTD